MAENLSVENLSHDFYGRASAGSKLFDCPSRVAAALSPGRSCPVPLKSQLCEARQAAKKKGATGPFSSVSVKNWSFNWLTMGAERIDSGFTFIRPSSSSSLSSSSSFSFSLSLFDFSAGRDCRIVEGVRPFYGPFSSLTPFNTTKTNCVPRARSAKDEVDTAERIVGIAYCFLWYRGHLCAISAMDTIGKFS